MDFLRPPGIPPGDQWLMGGRPLRRLEPIRDRSGDLESAIESYRAMAGLTPRDSRDRPPVEKSKGILRWLDEAEELSSEDVVFFMDPLPRGRTAPTSGVLRLSHGFRPSGGSTEMPREFNVRMEWR
jgi:hypothetical protein